MGLFFPGQSSTGRVGVGVGVWVRLRLWLGSIVVFWAFFLNIFLLDVAGSTRVGQTNIPDFHTL